jgi:hypothetical protein
MNNYYDYFDVMITANKKEILLAYENKITKYNNLKSLSNMQMNEIRILKKGLYILTNDELREKYNKKLFNIPIPENQNNLQSLDAVFNIDNSWMKTVNVDDSNNRKNSDTNVLGNRIFSLTDLNKQNFSTDSEIFLRKQQCGREDKTKLL